MIDRLGIKIQKTQGCWCKMGIVRSSQHGFSTGKSSQTDLMSFQDDVTSPMAERAVGIVFVTMVRRLSHVRSSWSSF